MSYVFEDLLKRSGVNQLKPGQKRRDVMPSHGLRKFFITACDKANISYTVREFLSGHKLPNLDPSYVHRHRNEEDMLAEYVKVIPLLSIDPTQRLQQENHDLKSVQAEKIAELQEEIDRNRKNTEHALAMVEAVKGALDAKSKAAYMATKSVLGIKSVL
jgi:hypothetical protein